MQGAYRTIDQKGHDIGNLVALIETAREFGQPISSSPHGTVLFRRFGPTGSLLAGATTRPAVSIPTPVCRATEKKPGALHFGGPPASVWSGSQYNPHLAGICLTRHDGHLRRNRSRNEAQSNPPTQSGGLCASMPPESRQRHDRIPDDGAVGATGYAPFTRVRIRRNFGRSGRAVYNGGRLIFVGRDYC